MIGAQTGMIGTQAGCPQPPREMNRLSALIDSQTSAVEMVSRIQQKLGIYEDNPAKEVTENPSTVDDFINFNRRLSNTINRKLDEILAFLESV